jgi:alpha-glucuronidase
MAWNPDLNAPIVTDEWVRLTFGDNKSILDSISEMILTSRAVYAKYNAPLGLGFMVNPGFHYGPSPEGYEFSKWGTYHRATDSAIGVDRTASGTGYTRQYHPHVAKVLEDLQTCPEYLLLFIHRLTYDYVLSNGETLLQHIYDTHFEGVQDVEQFIEIWHTLEDKLPKAAYEHVNERLQRQLAHAIEWRDVINTYFYRKTGIADKRGRKIYE